MNPNLDLREPAACSTHVPLGTIYRVVRAAAHLQRPVLIVGEPGTGKEVVARQIHSLSSRRARAFLLLNCCSDSPEQLQAAMLRLTGNDTHRVDVGTVVFENVGDLSLKLQGMLLYVIEQIETCGRIRSEPPIGVITTNRRSLQFAVGDGSFRRDLYFRLGALTLRVPALRDCRAEIPMFAMAMLTTLSSGTSRESRFSGAAINALVQYNWPGNLRELEDCVERAYSAAEGPIIDIVHLPLTIRKSPDVVFPPVVLAGVTPLNELEKRGIEHAMRVLGGDKRKAAELLGIGKTTLYRKLQQYHLCSS